MRFTRNAKPETQNWFSCLLHLLLRRWLRKTLPRTRGTIALSGLAKEVKVTWDPYSVPHLYAANEHDLFLAQGYLHAQERLWQMEFKRRLLCGRMAEVAGNRAVPADQLSVQFRGKSTVDLDYFIRLLGIRRAARASLRRLPERYVEILEAYSAGVNRYIEAHLNSLPFEFRLLRYEPEPWRPEDCLTIGKGFAFFLSTSLITRLAWIAIADRLAGQQDKLQSLLPTYPVTGPSITRAVAAESRELLRFMSGIFQQAGWAAGGQGSNNWVLAPGRSATGSPILCNDPHLRMELPPVWYLVHLQAARAREDQEEFEVWGASIAGSPGVQLGHNRWIAWGVTAALCDDAELYLEKIHPQQADFYLADGQWTKVRSEEETIAVRGGGEIVRKVRLTRHGPLLSDFTRGASRAGEEALAFRWTAHDPSREMCALDGVNRARNWDEFREAISHQVAPTLNYVYADRSGNIGYSLAGRVPLRPRPPSFLPMPGWSSEFEWKGSIPFEELPHLYNPTEGVIATANNRIVDHSYPYHLSDLFEPPYRIRRIKELLTARETFSVEDMAEMQQDSVSLHGRDLVGILRDDLEAVAGKNADLRSAAEKLLSWNGDCSENSAEAALFHLFYQRLTANLLTAELGPELFLAYTEIFNQSLAPVEQILRDPRSPWFAKCARPAMSEKSLREACDELAQRVGTDMGQWSWGKIHTLTLRHPLDRIRLLRPLLSIGPFPSPGDAVTIKMGFYRHSNPYDQVVGPSLRMIIDLAALERSLFVIPSGQSGHFFSPHYRDQTELWRAGRFIHLSHDAEAAKAWPVLTLAPGELEAGEKKTRIKDGR